MPTPVLLIIFFSCIIILQCLSSTPSKDLLPSHSRLVSLSGVSPKRGSHVYLDVSTRQLVFSEKRLDAYERREERREQRKLRKYYRLREAIRQYRTSGPQGIPEIPEAEMIEVV